MEPLGYFALGELLRAALPHCNPALKTLYTIAFPLNALARPAAKASANVGRKVLQKLTEKSRLF